jgi:hypothetical protein
MSDFKRFNNQAVDAIVLGASGKPATSMQEVKNVVWGNHVYGRRREVDCLRFAGSGAGVDGGEGSSAGGI